MQRVICFASPRGRRYCLVSLPFLLYIGYHRKYYATKTKHWNYANYPALKPLHAVRQWLYFRMFGFVSQRIDAEAERSELVSNETLNGEYRASLASGERCIRVVVISDTHELHRQLHVAHGDVLVHCGDMLFANVHRFDEAESMRKLADLNDWLGSQPHAHKVVVAGNHDYACERMGAARCRKALSNATYLEHEALSLEIRGHELKLFASPHSIPNSDFSTNRAFQCRRDEIGARWALIPDDVEVLITHHMPAGYLCTGKGCQALLHTI